MNALHITNHIGTTRNVENVFRFLDMSANIHSDPCEFPLYIHLNQADDIFHKYFSNDRLAKYNTLIFTDIPMYARPFLQNIEDHDKYIIVYITNRFDWGAWYNGDLNYNALYAAVSRHPRVRFISDNRYDQYYASLNEIEFYFNDIVRLTPEIIPLSKSNRMVIHNCKLFIYNRGTFIRFYEHFMKPFDIEYDVFGYDGYQRYKDESQIAEYIGFLHLPYQTNIQSLWENLGHQIVYFIPSKSFLKQIVTEFWYYWEEKLGKPGDLIFKSIDLAEWYQPEHEHLFVYFDSWQDLETKYHYYLENNHALLEKKRMIYEYMIASNQTHLSKWKTLIESIST